MQLVQALVLALLVSHVGATRCLVSSDGGDDVSSCQEALPDEASFALPVHAGEMTGALALYEAYYLGDSELRRGRNHHMHLIRHQAPFFDLALFLLGELTENFPEMRAQWFVERSPSAFRYNSHFERLRPSYSSIVILLVVCLAAHDLEFHRWAPVTVKLLLPPRQSRGNSPDAIGAEFSGRRKTLSAAQQRHIPASSSKAAVLPAKPIALPC